MKRVLVFTGAGVSAESGLKTFRDHDGLWENYKVTEVATPEAWKNNPKLVLDFYNMRRKQLVKSKPNEAHKIIAQLEKHFEVQIVTQNIDDLHERAGSSNILHLHGELMKAQSSRDESMVVDIKGWKLGIGDRGPDDAQLRPHVVWFGEAVPNMPIAYKMLDDVDLLVIVGTSLSVYPAAGIVDFAAPGMPKFLVDPNDVHVTDIQNLTFIKEKASSGMRKLADKLIAEYA